MTHNVVPIMESTTATMTDGRPALETQWITDHAAHVSVERTVAFPESWFLSWSIITTSNAAQALPADLSIFGAGAVKISGLTGETVQITALMDGSVVSDPIMVRKTDGTFVAASALGNGTYYFPVCFKSARLIKSSTVETLTATFSFKTAVGTP